MLWAFARFVEYLCVNVANTNCRGLVKMLCKKWIEGTLVGISNGRPLGDRNASIGLL